ncbi:MAG TPA: CoA pyrophosphatase [Rhodanobacteraceae bacterium]
MSRVVSGWADELLPLDQPPRQPGWNHAAIADWLGDAPLVPAAVLVPVREDGQQNIIFTRRHDALAHHAGQVAFPGGGMEADDVDIIDTALRETEEEIGLPRAAVTPLGFLGGFETISGYFVTPVVARVATSAPPLRPSADEVAAVFEVPLDFFLDPGHLHRYTMEYRGQRRSMVEFHVNGYRIWGATAAMLCSLLERMGMT